MLRIIIIKRWMDAREGERDTAAATGIDMHAWHTPRKHLSEFLFFGGWICLHSKHTHTHTQALAHTQQTSVAKKYIFMYKWQMVNNTHGRNIIGEPRALFICCIYRYA